MSMIFRYVGFLILCIPPIIVLGAGIYLMGLSSGIGEENFTLSEPQQENMRIIVLNFKYLAWFGISASILLIAYCLRSSAVPPGKRKSWAWSLFLGNAWVNPIFWYFYVLR